MQEQTITAAEVLNMVRTALASPAAHRSDLQARLAHARELQRIFRSEPVGGHLVWLKKLVHWFTASTFDRQAKAVEALLDVAQDLVAEADRATTSRDAAALVGGIAASRSTAAGSVVPEPTFEGEGSPQGLPAILRVNAEMMLPEKVLLYGLIFGLKPLRCLEIGTFRGGSAAVICAAMDDNGYGRLVCVDPDPRIPPPLRKQIAHRATVIAEGSPQALPKAQQVAGGRFTFALIDGDHGREGVLRDIEGTLEHLDDGGYLLFHDSHYFEVAEAIDEALERHPRRLLDCGMLSTAANPVTGEGSVVDGRQVVWGGLRLLKQVAA